MSLQIVISTAVGLATGIFMAYLWLMLSDPLALSPGRHARRRLGRWKNLLSAIPLPGWLEQRWQSAGFMLLCAGFELEPRAFMGLRWGLVWLAGLVSGFLLLIEDASFFRIFMALSLLLLCWWGPVLWLQWKSEERLQRLNHRLPDLMDRLRLGLEAGLGFEWALRRSVINNGGLLEDELRVMLAMLDRGHTKAEALDRLVKRNPSADLRSFAAAVKQAEKLGSSLTKSLEIQGRLLRANRRRRAQEASRRLPILIVFPLVVFFLPALLIIYLGPPLLHLFLGQ